MWLHRRERLRALADFGQPQRATEVEHTVRTLAAQVGVEPPMIVVRTHDKSEGRVFGLPGRYVLRLDARRLGKRVDELADLWRRRESPTFRAGILHELGHIANHDVGRSQFALAMWKVFIVLAILPLTLLGVVLACLIFSEGSPLARSYNNIEVRLTPWTGSYMPMLFVQMVGIVLVMRASWSGLLRVREFYADWRAVQWGAGDAIRSILLSKVAQEEGRAVSAAARHSVWVQQLRQRMPRLQQSLSWLFQQWNYAWRFHTPARDRLARIDDPSLLFRVSQGLAFHTGILLALVTVGLPLLIIYLGLTLFPLLEVICWVLVGLTIELPYPLNYALYVTILMVIRLATPIIWFLVLLFLLAYLITRSLGQQVQSSAVVDLLMKEKQPWGYMQLWKPALWLTIGQEIGFWIIPSPLFLVRSPLMLILTPIWLVCCAVLTWFWLVYTRALSQQLLGRHTGAKNPTLKRQLVSVCSMIALWSLYLPMFFTRLSIAMTPYFDYGAEMFKAVGATYPLTFMFIFTIFMLLSIGMVFFILWTLLSFGALALWRSNALLICPWCRSETMSLIAVGETCHLCQGRLAAWIFTERRRLA